MRTLLGITKALLNGQQNFILHFKNEPSFEMTSEYRDEVLDVIQ